MYVLHVYYNNMNREVSYVNVSYVKMYDAFTVL